MKMKNMLIGGMSLALVACISIGGTLAYFTATADAKTNTFTFAGSDGTTGLTVTLEEVVPETFDGNNAKAEEKEDHTGYDYTNIVPGDVLDKTPVITVKGTIDSYVFVRVTGTEDLSPVWNTANGWTEVTNPTVPLAENQKVYYYSGAKSTDGVISAEDMKSALTISGVDGEKVFNEVKVADDAVVPKEGDAEAYKIGDVKIEIAAIQANLFESATDAYNALTAEDWQSK